MTQASLFDERHETKAPQRRAPDALNSAEMKRLMEWAEAVVPWISREALGSFQTVDSYTQETLEYWQGSGKTKANWVATIMNRIRTQERYRLERLVRDGSKSAELALRAPDRWRDQFEQHKALKPETLPQDPTEPLRPTGGHIIQLQR